MSLELLLKVDERLTSALAFHSSSRDFFMFLALQGFTELHQYQYITESNTKRNLKKYVIVMYNQILQEYPPININPIDSLIKKEKLTLASPNSKWLALQAVWNEYIAWEKNTLNEYGFIGKQLIDDGDVTDYGFVSKIIKDVAGELITISDMATALNGMEWDYPTIVSIQPEIEQKYIKKIKRLYKDNPPI